MGGRGSYSAGSIFGSSRKYKNYPLATGQMNTGNAKGTSEEQTVERWRRNTVNEDYEYGGWIDSQGFVHSMTTDEDTSSVRIELYSKAQHHQGNDMVATIHNHPADAKRGYGGTFSAADILAQNTDFIVSGGKAKVAYATAREGIYKSTFSKSVDCAVLDRTLRKIEKQWNSKTYTSRKQLWGELHSLMRDNLKQYGIKIEFIPSNGKGSKLVAPKLKNRS